MGWETRRGRRYFYRKARTPDGVRSVYIGSGHFAETVAEADRLAAEEAAQRRRETARTLAPIDAALDALRTAEDRLRPWRDAYLVATGHRSHRGQWRRRRGLDAPPFILDSHPAERPDPMPTDLEVRGAPASTDAEAAARAELVTLLKRCNVPDPPSGALPALRAALRAFPTEPDGPPPSGLRVRTALAALAGSTATARELAEFDAETFARQLRADDDGPLVLAAVTLAADARLVWEAVGESYARALSTGYTLALGDHLERRMNAAQTRYLRAVATVAKLREVEAKERRRADRHGLQMDAARRALPARGDRHGDRRGLYADLRPSTPGMDLHAFLPAPPEVEPVEGSA